MLRGRVCSRGRGGNWRHHGDISGLETYIEYSVLLRGRVCCKRETEWMLGGLFPYVVFGFQEFVSYLLGLAASEIVARIT